MGAAAPPNAFVNLNISTVEDASVDWSPLRFASRARGPTHGEQFCRGCADGITDRALKIIDLWVKVSRCRHGLKHAVAKLNVISPDAFRPHCCPHEKGIRDCGYWISLHPSFHSPSLRIANCSEPKLVGPFGRRSPLSRSLDMGHRHKRWRRGTARSRAGFTPFSCASAHRDAFEPTV